VQPVNGELALTDIARRPALLNATKRPMPLPETPVTRKIGEEGGLKMISQVLATRASAVTASVLASLVVFAHACRLGA
jgi:hypothetical protein